MRLLHITRETPMKTLIAVIAAAVVASGGAYVIVSNSQSAKLKQAQAEWDKQRAELEAALNQPGKPGRTIVLNGKQAAAPAKETPAEILDTLTHVKILTGAERNRSMRQVIYGLEKLSACGVDAVPPIRQ